MATSSREEHSPVKSARLAVVAVVALLSVWILAKPGDAAAAENVLAGKPRIGTVRAMIPQRGRDAGRLVVWVRLDHAAGTRRGVRRERPETLQTGRVMARVGGRSRVMTRQLDLDRRRLPGGYFLRFPKSTAKAVAAGVGRRVPVSLRAVQTVDLDSDGDAEERAAVAATRRVALATPPATIEPADGSYINRSDDAVTVKGGSVTGVRLMSTVSGPCRLGACTEVSAPIDPQRGIFAFESKGTAPAVDVSVQGVFNTTTNATVFAQINVPSDNCFAQITDNFFNFLPDAGRR
jgi:hypothetical protein